MVLISRRYPFRDGHSCQVQGPWSLILDTWSLILDTWYLILDTWSLILDPWYLILDTWCSIIDTWSLFFDHWSLIFNLWSMIHDPWSMIHDPWWEAFAPRMSLRSGSGPGPVRFRSVRFRSVRKKVNTFSWSDDHSPVDGLGPESIAPGIPRFG